MPYSLSEPDKLPSNVQKLSEPLKKRWIGIFNSAIKQGKPEADAFKLANGIIKKAEGKTMDEAPNYHESGEPVCSCATCTYAENGWCTMFMFLYNPASVCDNWQPNGEIFGGGENMPMPMKAGARHSGGDMKMVQTIHDHAVSLGAMCGEEGKTTITASVTGSNGITVTAKEVPFTLTEGNCLKAISETETEIRVGNYLALWGGPDKRDLEGLGSQRKNADGSIGEYFTKSTDFESTYTQTGMLYVDWEHGRDDLGKDDILGHVDWSTAKADERGLWVERVLNRRNKYVQWLKNLIDAGLVGTSSEPVQPRVAKATDGHILRWPLKRDTLTVNPMEPRMLSENILTALKALEDIPCVKDACLKAGLLSNDLGTKETELSLQAKLAYIKSQME